MRPENRKHHGLLWAGALLLVACQPMNAPRVAELPDLEGQVDFGDGRLTQSTDADVAIAATVSLIDVSTTSASPTTPRNQTVATSVTNSSGQFVLSFRGFSPSATESYILEAVKGLQSNKVGVSAARVRTLMRFQGGWISLTNLVPNTSLRVSRTTTALSIMQGLRTDVAPSTLMGTLQLDLADNTLSPATTDTFTPPAGCPITNQDFHTVTDYVRQALVADNDPIGTVIRNNSGTYEIRVNKAPIVTGVSPTSAGVGARVTIAGSQFDPVAANNTVRFNGVAATVVSATDTQLVVTVPNATSGNLSIANPYGTTVAGAFTIVPSLSGQFPAN